MVAEAPRSARTASARIASGGTKGSVACAHCGLPVPRGLVVAGETEQFCCAGCRTVHGVIGACGLERYYELLKSAAGDGKQASVTGRDYAEFDDPTFARLYVQSESDGTRSAELFVEGVHCVACLWLLERLPRVAPGVVESRLDVRRSIVRVRWDPQATGLSAAAQALDRLGYPAHPARTASARAARQREERRQLVRLGVAGACAGNVMLLALAMYAGLFDAMDPSHLRLFRWVSMSLSLVAVSWPGAVFFRAALAALRTRTVLLDLPIAVALAVGTAWGVINTVRGAGEIYFDSLSVLVFALLLGRYLQQRQQRWSADAVELLYSLTPTSAVLLARAGP
ncbi:MAG: heavy metal translocating P-type ATPase, partial [Phycisphaerales bacterium]|nr:heavy metal translocating P-type ATPase [Phycisphaerales bacterium]